MDLLLVMYTMRLTMDREGMVCYVLKYNRFQAIH